MNKLPDYLDDVLEILYPSLCVTCGERLNSQEAYVCMQCWLDLPVNRFTDDSNNKVAQLFWGRVRIEHAASYFQYRKGSRYQELIHFIKYKGLKELGYETGKRFGNELAESDNFKFVDLIVPVPLHKLKLRKRRYNQSEWIAMGIAAVLKKPIITGNLFRQIHTPTQTRKSRYERWMNVDGIFGINLPAEFEGKHILLIDDVVTTGSTLEACACELLKIKGVKVSIATLAFAEF